MIDYIPRTFVLQFLEETQDIDELRELINDIPPSKVEEVHYGVWKEFSEDNLDPRMICSNCGEIHIPEHDEVRCPYCGSIMGEEATW